MTFRQSVRLLCVATVLGLTFASAASAQNKPTPAALLVAKELIDLKGATKAFDPLVNGVIEYQKNVFMQTNSNLSKDLNLVAQQLANQLASRKIEMQQHLARIYAQHFSEQELKDALAFYRSPLGKKLTAEEPKAQEEAVKAADDWSRTFAAEVAEKFRAEMKKRGHSMF